LVIDLQRHVGEEGRLGTAKVITSAAVQDFAVMLDLEDEMIHHAFGHVDLTIDEQSKTDEV